MLLHKRVELENEDVLIQVLDFIHANAIYTLMSLNDAGATTQGIVSAIGKELYVGLERLSDNAYVDLAPRASYEIDELLEQITDEMFGGWTKREVMAFVETSLSVAGIFVGVEWKPESSCEDSEYR